ncbi:hypothetical protein Taro_036629 [Colocasia esculenta]|uniref:Uncharacterized protein n=1 Tax=Colocasia esculenta TaxID=4460 RepID=A0A843WIE3_COLES|nr:hypothetical protein [Colocasia esculenta]
MVSTLSDFFFSTLDIKNESCNFFMWCDDFMAAGTSCKSPCQCNEEVMQKLVQGNEKLRKRLHQLEKKTRIVATLGREFVKHANGPIKKLLQNIILPKMSVILHGLFCMNNGVHEQGGASTLIIYEKV